MKVFKFGGASVKDAAGVKNVANVLSLYRDESLMVIVSAMGKTTNALERLLNAYYHGESNVTEIFEELKKYHTDIIADLYENKSKRIYDEIENIFIELECILEKPSDNSYDFTYDQVVSFGEILSTKIISDYLNEEGYKNRWIDARNFIITDSNYRNGKIDWNNTFELINKKLRPIVNKQLVISQGFIGKSNINTTTTLGREGSDYSAAIFAYCLEAESMTIWKDVEGVMNADPKRMPDAVKLDHLSYNQAIELAYYGATVIHPKTIQPLKNKEIPLHVKCFLDPSLPGTNIDTKDISDQKVIPNFIFKNKQALISISSKDFSFIVEDNLSYIFSQFAQNKLPMNVMQNSAISFAVDVNYDEGKVERLKEILSEDYNFELNKDVELITIHNPTQDAIESVLKGKEVLLEQKMKNVVHFVVK